jgi:spermidine dehydrogenase
MENGDAPPRVEPDDGELGLNEPITRRDFLNASLLGAGAALLHLPAPARLGAQSFHEWTGPGGVGDYARSNGNTWEVIEAAHGLRDGRYAAARLDAADTGETCDLVVAGRRPIPTAQSSSSTITPSGAVKRSATSSWSTASR